MSEAAVKAKSRKPSRPRVEVATGLLDILSPTAMEFQAKSIVNGEVYQRVIVITDYPERVAPGWLSRISTMPGVVMSIHAVPTDPFDLVDQIKKSMGELESKIFNSGNTFEIQRSERQLKSAQHLLRKIDDEAQGVFHVTVTLLVTAKDRETLDERCKRVESALAAAGMRGRVAMFRQEDGYRTVGPYGILEPKISEIGARNMPVETIAASYPFVYSGINDGDGVLLGTDKDGGILLVDFWIRDGSRTNSNVTILGRPGVGKSTLIKKILMSEFARGTVVIIIDPEREYKDLCHNLEGDWISCGGGGKGRINPFQIRHVPLDDEEDDDPLFSKEQVAQGPLALHFQVLRTFFKLYFGKEITKIEMNYLEVALEEVYKQKGITWQTDPAQLKNEDYPIMEDLYKWLQEKAKQEPGQPVWEKLMMLVRPAAVGADAAIWNGPSTLEANSNFIVLDTHDLIESDKEIQQAQYFNILSWCWHKISQDRTKRVILAGDEFYLNVDPENPEVLKFVRNTSKRIRKYEGGLMVITHNMNDFMDPAVRRFGQSLLDNPVYKIIMGQGENDIQSLTTLMHLSEKEVEMLLSGNRGEALFIAGNRRVHAKIEVSPEELAMFGKGGGR